MQVIVRLKHIWHSRINDPFANPIALACCDAGINAQTLGTDTLLIHGKPVISLPSMEVSHQPDRVISLPHAASDYLYRLRRYDRHDRIEALPQEALDLLSKLSHDLAKRDAKKGIVSVIPDTTPLFNFSLSL
jgi:hypothetical protein